MHRYNPEYVSEVFYCYMQSKIYFCMIDTSSMNIWGLSIIYTKIYYLLTADPSGYWVIMNSHEGLLDHRTTIKDGRKTLPFAVVSAVEWENNAEADTSSQYHNIYVFLPCLSSHYLLCILQCFAYIQLQ